MSEQSITTSSRQPYSPREVARVVRETHERTLDYRDLFQLPTGISLSGLALVNHGCKNINTIAGVNCIAVGRGFDLLDGTVARALEQESDVGALVDATCDKLGMALISYAALKQKAIPKSAIAAMVAGNVTSAGLTAAAAYRHPHDSYRPTRTGKYGMALYNLGFISYLYSHAFEQERPELELHEGFHTLGTVATGAGVALSFPTNAEYAKRVL